MPDEDYLSLVLTAYTLLLAIEKGSEISSGGVPGALSSISAIPFTRRLICPPSRREEVLEHCATSEASIQNSWDGSAINVPTEFRSDLSKLLRAPPMNADALDNFAEEVFGRQAFCRLAHTLEVAAFGGRIYVDIPRTRASSLRRYNLRENPEIATAFYASMVFPHSNIVV